MVRVKHEFAVLYDENYDHKLIHASELASPKTLDVLRKQILYDQSGQVRVVPRVGEGRVPHFYECEAQTARRRFSQGESSQDHNARVNSLITTLSSLQRLSLALVSRPKGQPFAPEQVQILFDLRFYAWESEAHRILDKETIVRHDIFGQRRTNHMSVRMPWVAVEVIHSHYPDELTFAALLRASENVPMVVLFDFTSFKNRFLRANQEKARLEIRPWSFYIWNGCLWKGAFQTSIRTSRAFRKDVESLTAKW